MTCVSLGYLAFFVAALATARNEEVLVRTRAGQVLRAERVGEGDSARILFEAGGRKIPVPPSEIVSVEPLAPLLREYRQRRARARASLEEKIALGAWCAEQGLYEEMEKELDAVLEQDPLQADAQRILESLPVRFLVGVPKAPPEEQARFLIKDGGQKLDHPTKARLIELRLKSLGVDLVEPILVERFGSVVDRERAFALGALGRIAPGERLEYILTHALLDRSGEARQMALEALQWSRDPEVIHPLVRALQSKHHPVRLHAIRALGALRDPRAVGELIARVEYTGGTSPRSYISVLRQTSYIQDFDVEVAQASFIADPVVNILQDGQVTDVNVVGLSGHADVRLEHWAAFDAMRDITGKDFGRDAKAWGKWWEENQQAVIEKFVKERGNATVSDR